MRTSVLSRSIVAAAALAVGSAVLAAVPATAATPSGITREMVLTAANGVRAAQESIDPPPVATQQAVRAILNRACNVDADAGEFVNPGTINALPVRPGSSADGLAVGGQVVNFLTPSTRWCLAGVVASTTPSFDLTGSMTLTAQPSGGGPERSITAPLSGDVVATPPLVLSDGISGLPTFTAAGAATKTTYVPAKTVKDKKTKAEKMAAKKKYKKRIAAAKKKYAKALDKAGSNKAKKATAKKAYSAARTSAKSKYRYATANYRIVKKATKAKDVRPFNLTLLTF
ncbi:hypothetical protein [Aeromicrobium endophyticum]|uniref:SH3 domain-containing protein n=1 Tax=Aeromicrobium endophyticum TaxID=2292704 RepID=A0A371PAR1_9ACTN|nr:hypothetical protein [Aeromicrobium endophyticum]REK73044.1 hypothetical protein DX116_05505 [Aeromicrobium endophyticum]